MNRLPSQSPTQNEYLRPYVAELIRLAGALLEHDNELNAVICLRIIFELHKNYRPMLQNEVQPFLDYVQKIYRELPGTMTKLLGVPGTMTKLQSPASGGSLVPGQLLSSTESFKVFTECPLIVTLLFQLYPRLASLTLTLTLTRNPNHNPDWRFLSPNMQQLTPLMVKALSLQPPQGSQSRQKEHYADFMAAQVKTLYYITYHLGQFTDIMQPYRDSITVSVIQLLMNCPNESVGMRRELLVATRHILQTDFRVGFFSKVCV